MDRGNRYPQHHHREESPPPPPPPQVTHVHHTSHNPPPPTNYSAPHGLNQQPPPPQPHQTAPHNYQQPPPPPQPHYTAPPQHDINPPPPSAHVASSVHHVSHTTTKSNQHDDPLANKQAVRVYSKANPDYSLTIRDGKVILAPNNPSDLHQHWVKDLKYSTRVKDEQGYPSFSLINKATGQAMKHSVGATHPVQLIPYNDDKLDESILWTESKDLGDTYKTIRMINNIQLNVDAYNGDPQHGGVVNGTKIVLWEWKKGDNQRWKIVSQ